MIGRSSLTGALVLLSTTTTTTRRLFFFGASSLTIHKNKNKTHAMMMSAWTVCRTCRGVGRKRVWSKKRSRYKQQQIQQSIHYPTCKACEGRGIVVVTNQRDATGICTNIDDTQQQQQQQKVCIVGAGMGGLALAIACCHRGFIVDVYERDASFHDRHQGYGLTLQQARSQLASLGIMELPRGITSTQHIVHQADGTVVGKWGMRHWKAAHNKNKKQNVHIARQHLRQQLYEQAQQAGATIHWNHKFIAYNETTTAKTTTTTTNNPPIVCQFQVSDRTVSKSAHWIVGADGIRSAVRLQLLGEDAQPLRFLDCLVMLGITKIQRNNSHELLDGYTVFQTADGTTRMYMMPYDNESYMWQLSFPTNLSQAQALSGQPSLLKQEALRRCGGWHAPIPSILSSTQLNLITGYPVYDRALLQELPALPRRVTLLGDAAHPMSPFKGQGANQAILDALSLARTLYRDDIIPDLTVYESEMMERTAPKVVQSGQAAKFLHSEVAIHKGNLTRGEAYQRSQANKKACENGGKP